MTKMPKSKNPQEENRKYTDAEIAELWKKLRESIRYRDGALRRFFKRIGVIR